IIDIFFFQAEDGIRDFHVTGVQTCALPIYILGKLGVNAIVFVVDSADRPKIEAAKKELHGLLEKSQLANIPVLVLGNKNDLENRSEERRVGKECRSRWWANAERKEDNSSRE